MRILVVGAGAVGGYFGEGLARAGRDVTFLVRPRRAEALARDGLAVRTPEGTRRTTPVTVTAADLTGPYDLVLLSVKAYALEAALADIAPAVGERTMILPLLNGMRHVDVLRERFGDGPVIGGLCRVATDLAEDGTIVQLGPGAEIVYGEFDGSVTPRLREVDAALSGVGFETTLSTTVEADMWGKWFMLAALGAVTTLLGGPIGAVEAAPGGDEAARGIVAECAATVAASGFAMPQETVDAVTALCTRPGSNLTSSLYRDLVAGRPVEADQILGDLAARGRDHGVSVTALSLARTALHVRSAQQREALAGPAAPAHGG